MIPHCPTVVQLSCCNLRLEVFSFLGTVADMDLLNFCRLATLRVYFLFPYSFPFSLLASLKCGGPESTLTSGGGTNNFGLSEVFQLICSRSSKVYSRCLLVSIQISRLHRSQEKTTILASCMPSSGHLF